MELFKCHKSCMDILGVDNVLWNAFLGHLRSQPTGHLDKSVSV